MRSRRSSIIFVAAVLILVGIALAIPTGFERPEFYDNVERVKAEVLEVNDDNVFATGALKVGHQELVIKILAGQSRGETLAGINNGLSGKLEKDKFFAVGDKLLLTVKYDDDGSILYTNVVDHYRINVEAVLALLYLGALLVFSGWTGFKAALSFVFALVYIYKVMLPLILKGYNAIFVSMAIVILMSFVILFLVAGFNKKGLVAFLGATLGILFTGATASLFGKPFMVDGSVMPFAEALLYAGHTQINLTEVLYASIFISSSGAVMDVGMDIAAAQEEIVLKLPSIGAKELIGSGIAVSRMMIGTMTTTLLLAYTGSYMTTLMTFIANGIPLMNVLNIRYVASEILNTLVGSFGLILVAPFTSVVGGLIFSRHWNLAAGRSWLAGLRARSHK